MLASWAVKLINLRREQLAAEEGDDDLICMLCYEKGPVFAVKQQICHCTCSSSISITITSFRLFFFFFTFKQEPTLLVQVVYRQLKAVQCHMHALPSFITPTCEVANHYITINYCPRQHFRCTHIIDLITKQVCFISIMLIWMVQHMKQHPLLLLIGNIHTLLKNNKKIDK